MSKYIDADKLKVEIERRKKRLENGTGDPEVMKRVEGVIKGYNYILDLITSLQQEQPEVDLEKEIDRVFFQKDCGSDRLYHKEIANIARHFVKWAYARKSIWHNVAEETPTKYGEEVIVACRNKNKEDGIWLYDLIQCWEGKWEPRVNWETPVKWAYVKDLDIEARKEE